MENKEYIRISPASNKLPQMFKSPISKKKYERDIFDLGENKQVKFLWQSKTHSTELENNEIKKKRYSFTKYLKKLYIERTHKERIHINIGLLLSFLVIAFISFKLTHSLSTLLLIIFILYSIYFLLVAIYLLSTVLEDTHESYRMLTPKVKKEYCLPFQNKDFAASFINQGDTQSNLNLAHNVNMAHDLNMAPQRMADATETQETEETEETEETRETQETQETQETKIEQEESNKHEIYCKMEQDKQNKQDKQEMELGTITYYDKNNLHPNNKNNEKTYFCEEQLETNKFNDISKSVKEGSEGFFSVQYDSLKRIILIFSVCIFFLYIGIGEEAMFFPDTSDGTKNKKFAMVLPPFKYAITTAFSFLLGSTCSALAGYIGIYVSVRTNVKVAKAATQSYEKALIICFKSGAVSSIINVALSILGISILLLVVSFCYPDIYFSKCPLLISGYGLGASIVAMVSQLAGGIYTKAADIGADLSGKIEQGITEDDCRNPAVIADLVGDNVGDCAGQCADLFESLSNEIIASMILGGVLSDKGSYDNKKMCFFVLFPLFIHSMDLLISTIGVCSIRKITILTSKKEKNLIRRRNIHGPMYILKTNGGKKTHETDINNMKYLITNKPKENQMHQSTLSKVETEEIHDANEFTNPLKIMLNAYFFTCLLSTLGFSILCNQLFYEKNNPYGWIYFAICGFIGMVCSYLFVLCTRYYTDYSYPKVRKIAAASLSGPATNIIAGLYVGLESTFLPIIVISISLLVSYYIGLKSNFTPGSNSIDGLYATAVTGMGMLSTTVFILTMSNFGPIADNAGGIVEMAKTFPRARTITDILDSVGNITKANTKGFSVGSAALASFLLFFTFFDQVKLHSEISVFSIDITLPEVFIGGMLGAVIVFVFAGWTLDAVGRTAEEVLKEVRRQFQENPEIITFQKKPDYKTCVAIISKKALLETIRPGILALLSPIVVALLFKKIGILQNNHLLGVQVTASFIMFSTATGILMALFFNNSGGAWDNAKKYIESGFYGGKKSYAHISSVIGDVVGDPCKDTAGPSIHVLIKLISTTIMVLYMEKHTLQFILVHLFL